jgi:hypothetical protein
MINGIGYGKKVLHRKRQYSIGGVWLERKRSGNALPRDRKEIPGELWKRAFSLFSDAVYQGFTGNCSI